jgi:WD40 repeat protein
MWSFVLLCTLLAHPDAPARAFSVSDQSPTEAVTLRSPLYYGVSIAFSPDGRYLAGIGSVEGSTPEQPRGVLLIWDANTRRIVRTLKTDALFLYSVAFSPNSKLVAAGAHDDQIRIWDVRTGRLRRTLPSYGARVLALAFSPNGEMLAAANYHQVVELWRIRSGRLLHRIEVGHRAMDVVFSPDGRTIAVAPEGRRISQGDFSANALTYDVKTGNLKHVMAEKVETDSEDIPNAVAYSPDGKLLACGSQYALRLWNARTGKLVKTLGFHRIMSHEVSSLAFSPDGRTLAAGSYDKTIRLWDTRTSKIIRTLNHKGGVWSVAYAPSGRVLAAGIGDDRNRERPGAVVLWNLR